MCFNMNLTSGHLKDYNRFLRYNCLRNSAFNKL